MRYSLAKHRVAVGSGPDALTDEQPWIARDTPAVGETLVVFDVFDDVGAFVRRHNIQFRDDDLPSDADDAAIEAAARERLPNPEAST